MRAKSACGRRWSPIVLRIALHLMRRSPTGYRALAETLCLPTIATLRSYASHVKYTVRRLLWSSVP